MSSDRKASPALRAALDYGPLIVFFAANFGAPYLRPLLLRLGMPADVKNLVFATAAVMVATLIAVVVSLWKLRRVSPILIFNAAIVLGFGGIALYLNDATFVKIKLTVLYALFAAILVFGMATGRPLLKLLLGEAFPTLDADGWRKLTRNWAIFFVALACLNEALRRVLSDDGWALFKFPGVVILTFAFMLAQAPILMRHGEEPPPNP